MDGNSNPNSTRTTPTTAASIERCKLICITKNIEHVHSINIFFWKKKKKYFQLTKSPKSSSNGSSRAFEEPDDGAGGGGNNVGIESVEGDFFSLS